MALNNAQGGAQGELPPAKSEQQQRTYFNSKLSQELQSQHLQQGFNKSSQEVAPSLAPQQVPQGPHTTPWTLQVGPSPPSAQQREPTGFTIPDPCGLVEENGRVYHGYMAGEYALPCDGEEQERLDFNHAVWELALDNRLALAPITSTSPRVLDVGTGTGIWAFEFARQNPDSIVIGTDLSLIQPSPDIPNIQFVLENSEHQEWVFPWNFDYVHFRSMGPCFQDIRTVIKKAFDSMNSGGWIEFQDGLWVMGCVDNSKKGTALERWFELVVKGAALAGRDMNKPRHFKEYLTQAGFVDVREVVLDVPVGTWARGRKYRELGRYLGTSLIPVFDAYRKFLELIGLSASEMDELSNAARVELSDSNIHWYMPAYFVYGRKR